MSTFATTMPGLSARTDRDRLLAHPLVYHGTGSDVPLRADVEDLALHRARRGYPVLTGPEFAEALSDSELTGRGGAHVPASWKLTAAREAGPGGIVVINGAEVDLATYDAAAAPDPWIAGQPVQEGGVWQVTLILPHGPDAPEAVRYPAPITVTGDGPVTLPG